MKKIEAIIRLTQFDKIREALASIEVRFFTLKEVKGYGLQKGDKMIYRGSVYGADYLARLQLDIFTTDEKVDEIVAKIIESGCTGEVGDGKVIVLNIDSISRIRTGETNENAI